MSDKKKETASMIGTILLVFLSICLVSMIMSMSTNNYNYFAPFTLGHMFEAIFITLRTIGLLIYYLIEWIFLLINKN